MDEDKSLDLTELRLLQTMKQLSNDMSLLLTHHRLQHLSLHTMTMQQVLEQVAPLLSPPVPTVATHHAPPSFSPVLSPAMAHMNQLVFHVRTSIRLASMEISRVSADILQLDGMSSHKVRHLLNNLGSFHTGVRYLEVGSWKGASLASALWGNENTMTSALAIDNFSQFGGSKTLFDQTVTDYVAFHNVRLYDGNAFDFDSSKNKNDRDINLYFYDGPHDEIDHYNALAYFNHMMAEVFIVVIDDWNFKAVRSGTQRALRNYEVIYKQILPSEYNGDVLNWWNGLFVAVLRRRF